MGPMTQHDGVGGVHTIVHMCIKWHLLGYATYGHQAMGMQQCLYVAREAAYVVAVPAGPHLWSGPGDAELCHAGKEAIDGLLLIGGRKMHAADKRPANAETNTSWAFLPGHGVTLPSR